MKTATVNPNKILISRQQYVRAISKLAYFKLKL